MTRAPWKLLTILALAALPATAQQRPAQPRPAARPAAPAPSPAPAPAPVQAAPQTPLQAQPGASGTAQTLPPGQPQPPMAPPQAPLQAQPGQPAGPGPSAKMPGDVQILLDRLAFSPGAIDGRWGSNSKKAVAAFQAAHNLQPTGQVDRQTWQALTTAANAAGAAQVLRYYTITPEDLQGPFLPIPEEMADKAKLPALGYSSPLEMLAERFHSTEDFLQRLNPGARFDQAGQQLRVPNVRAVPAPKSVPPAEGAQVVVSKSESTLRVEGPNGLLFFAPITAGSEHDPLPIGDWKVNGISYNPTFNYNPDLFWDAEPGDNKAKIPAGPNNPVGLVWIDISKEHYGLHGTPEPKTISKTTSHGCVRLTNWDALTVASLVKAGTPVLFRE